jgi:hypothetical protein
MFNLFKKKEQPWPFDQPENCASFTIKQIMNKELPIMVVYHDADDDGWQFVSNTELNMDDAMLVSLKNIVDIDPTVLEVAHIKPGFHAWRSGVGEKWNIKETPVEE